mgnify:CR=1 FL=1
MSLRLCEKPKQAKRLKKILNRNEMSPTVDMTKLGKRVTIKKKMITLTKKIPISISNRDDMNLRYCFKTFIVFESSPEYTLTRYVPEGKAATSIIVSLALMTLAITSCPTKL